MTGTEERSYLRRGVIDQLASSGHRSIWGLSTLASLSELQHPNFLGRCYAMSMLPGDQVMFTAGPEHAPVYGTLVVTAVKPGAGETSPLAEVHTALLNSTAPARPRLKAVS